MHSVTAQQLNQQFDPHQWPVFTAFEHQADSLHFELQIPPSLEYFIGHFPDQPVLPGVVQLHWVAGLARSCFQLSGFSRAVNVKFNTPVLPDMTVSLTLGKTADSNNATFRFFDAQQHYSSGKLIFSHSQVEAKGDSK